MSNDRYENIRKVLAECRDIAMEWTLRGRIPECGKFGEIAQDLDAVCAELAFLASSPVSVPGGWKLVPIEPTPEMLAANGTCKLAAGQQMLNDDARKTWRAMLSAAPSFTEKIAARQQPAGDDTMVERIAALLHEEATGEPWTVAGVEHHGPDRDCYRGLARKVAALAAQRQETTT